MLGFNPAYCCSGWANLLHTCNPPEAGTLSYSVLFIYVLSFQAAKGYTVTLAEYVCTVSVGGSVSLYQRQSGKYMAESDCLAEVIGQILG